MQLIYTVLNILILCIFLITFRFINTGLEFLNITKKQIRFNSSLPITVVKLGRFAKNVLKYLVFSIYPIVNLNIPNSSSMTPKFRSWDIIMASHSIYGFNVENITIKPLRDFLRQYWTKPVCVFSEPQVGDSVSFRLPNSDDVYSKMIIGKEGDEIWVRGNILTINDKICAVEFVERQELYEDNHKFVVKIYKITLPNGRQEYFAIDDNLTLEDVSEHQYIKVGKDQFFVLGLYMTNSLDSRKSLGLVARESIFAKLQWVVMRNPSLRSLNPINLITDSKFGIVENI